MNALKVREDRARRRLAREGYLLRKDRARSWNVDHQGGYMIVEADRNLIVAGERWNLTLEDVEAWLAH